MTDSPRDRVLAFIRAFKNLAKEHGVANAVLGVHIEGEPEGRAIASFGRDLHMSIYLIGSLQGRIFREAQEAAMAGISSEFTDAERDGRGCTDHIMENTDD